MLLELFILIHFCSFVFATLELPTPQVPISQLNLDSKPRKLHGRFLHVTDIHPDLYYRVNATTSSSCHSRKPKSETTRSTKYGVPWGPCDSPISLVNLTFDWIEKEWADNVDFVIWTGDSARHDNDHLTPRTPREIYDLNTNIARRMERIFTKRGIPVVPSIGNNDVWPHNIMTSGPNSITNEYASIWQSFIPFPSLQIFLRGGYYATELIPNRLAAISLNTMYFYDSNKAVGGCQWVNRDMGGGVLADPGNLELDWLEVQLDHFRQRGMKVWLSGHVPPSPGNYFPECYWRYAELALRYQDTILGHLYGHMNTDHFFYIEAADLREPIDETTLKANFKKHKTLHDALVQDFNQLKKMSKLDLNEYAIVHVSPSVVPNPYLPSVRVWGFNASEQVQQLQQQSSRLDQEIQKERDWDRPHPKKGRCKQKADKNKWWCQMPARAWFSDRDAPSRVNIPLSPLGYVQWWLPRLGSEKNETLIWDIEYATYSEEVLLGKRNGTSKSEGWVPIPENMIPEAVRLEPERYLPFGLSDGTIGEWMRVARKIGQKKKMSRVFRELMYMGGKEG